jgi:CheY-like chemotaxis protein
VEPAAAPCKRTAVAAIEVGGEGLHASQLVLNRQLQSRHRHRGQAGWKQRHVNLRPRTAFGTIAAGAAPDDAKERPYMRVLLIEDDALVRMTLSETLAEESIELDGLASAEDALVLLGAGQVPDVLVVDINLGPGLNGVDLAAIARERHPTIEVILISGIAADYCKPPLSRRERFLQKPFAPAVLAQAIRSAATAASARAAA